MKALIAAAISAACMDAALAQIAGNGLGTSVSQAGGAWTISAGTQVGGNLFHSFSAFSVPTSSSATFTGPGSVQHIIGRVTGPNASSIDGLLRSAIPGADLWLINPKGVTFGPNASLDVSGSVHISTADYLQLGSSGQFNATNPGASMLSSAPPSAFGFLGTPAPIAVNGSILTAANGKGLSLVGGAITLTGATLQAAGGDISLTSQADIHAVASTLDVSNGPMPASGSIRIVGGHFTATNMTIRADNSGTADGGAIRIDLSGAFDMSGGAIVSHATATGRSGDTVLTASDVTLLEGAQLVSAVNSGSSRGGDVTVLARNTMRVDGVDASGVFPSGLFATSAAAALGPAGSISLQAGSLELTGGGVVSATSAGAGAGGAVSVSVAGALTIRGESFSGIQSGVSAAAYSTGHAGSVSVAAGSLDVLDGGAIIATTAGAGAAGSVDVSVRGALRVNGKASPTHFSSISAGSGQFATGAAGSVTVSADSIRVEGDSEIAADTWKGTGGDVRVSARLIDVSENGSISALANSKGRGGDVNVTASEALTLGGHYRGTFAAIGSQSFGSGAAGNVTVSAPSMHIHHGGVIGADTYGLGDAGRVTVSGGRILITNSGSIESSTFGAGQAGGVVVTATDSIRIDRSPRLIAGIFSDSVAGGTGDAGTVAVSTDRLRIGAGGEISTDTDAAGRGGDITVSARRISVLQGGDISATTFGPSDAGNLAVLATGRLALSGLSFDGFSSGIFANAQGTGGAAGAIKVSAGSVAITNGGQISSSTFGDGNGGDVVMSVARGLRVVGGDIASGVYATSEGAGAAGNIVVSAARVGLHHGGVISSTTLSTGFGGDVRLSVGGDIVASGVNAGGSISGIFASSYGLRDAGSVEISAANLSLLKSGTVSSSGLDVGRGGDVRVALSGVFYASGTTPAGGSSGIFASASGTGDAGSISLSAANATLLGLAALSSSTFGTGKGGDVQVSIGGNLLIGGASSTVNSGIFASAQGAQSGAGGSVRVSASDITLRDGGAISASSFGPGEAGSVQVNAGTSLRLEDRGVIATRATVSDGGNIDIHVGRLVYLKDSSITTSVGGETGNGGNITIDPQFVVLNNSRIIANAVGGNGGNIRIVADNFLNQNGLVQASSQKGISGNISIESPRVDVSGALRVLSTDYLDASRLIRGSCASRVAEASTFLAGGRGGLAAGPQSGQELAQRRPVALGCGPLQGMAPVLDAPAPGDHHVAHQSGGS